MLFFISPHIDDAILSVGGFIKKMVDEGKEITVVSIFSKSNWVNPYSNVENKELNDVETISQIRKKEEIEVAKRLKYNYLFFDYNDFPIRHSSDEVDKILLDDVKSRLVKLIKKNDAVFFPIGMKHPDHKIAASAGIELLGEGFNVFFYEDLPYIANEYNFYDMMLANDYHPESICIDIYNKLELLEMYRSQMSFEWLNCVKMYSYNLLDNNHYERIWKKL